VEDLMGHFLSDLDRSRDPVNKLMEWYEKTGYIVRELPKNEQEYGDFSVTLLDVTVNIEVKFDEMSGKTGNLCFEMSNGSKLTGIMTTKADKVYYVVPNGGTQRVYVFDTEKLRAFIIDPANVTVKNGGDKRKFVLALAKVTKVMEADLPEEVFELA
jgi:hypothetical protein